MITVIIAGGSGSRLWPLSTSDYPKHLLRLIGERTMLQQAYDRAREVSETVYVVTEASHADHVRAQLTDLPVDYFLIEPGRRGTAHCILFALDAISRRHDSDEPIAFIHSDHYVRDVEGFRRSFHVAAENATARREITLIGVEPTYPATGFGYIQRDSVIDDEAGIYDVASFKEKPDYDTAQQYVTSGNYLWNCGYFVGSVSTFLSEMKQSAPDLYETYTHLHAVQEVGDDAYNAAYLALGVEVIDIALIEKAQHLAVVAASFDWVDVGSFKDLHDLVLKDEAGNHHEGNRIYPIEGENLYIRNEEDKPVVVIGLDNVVVVNTPHGILVARKDVSQKVKEAVSQMQDN